MLVEWQLLRKMAAWFNSWLPWPKAKKEPEPPPSPIRVLIVEDNPEDAQRMSWAVTQAGFTFEIQADAEAGLTSFLVHGHQIVIADIGLPGRDGWWLAGAVLDRAPATRVIITTGSPQARVSHLERGRAVVIVVKDGNDTYVAALKMLRV